jgi:hypothetical protein
MLGSRGRARLILYLCVRWGWVTVIVVVGNKSNCVIHKNTLSVCDMSGPQFSVIGSRSIFQCLAAAQGCNTKYLCRNGRNSGNLCNSRNTALTYCVGCYVNDDGILTWNVRLQNFKYFMPTHCFNLRIKPSAYEDMWIYYTRRKPPTCFGHLLLPSSDRCCTKDSVGKWSEVKWSWRH